MNSTVISNMPGIRKPTLLLLVFLITLSIFTMDLWRGWHFEQSNLEWDVANYYSYLPAFFGNGGSFNFGNHIDQYLQDLPGGVKVPIKTYGVAVLYFPFYAARQTMAWMSGGNLNGFGSSFYLIIHWAGIIYGFLGFLVLRKFLLRYFDELTTAVTLAVIFLGTNLFYYTFGVGEVDHVYLFFLLSCYLLLLDRWYESSSRWMAVALGLCMGLIGVIRHTELITVSFFLFWKVYDLKSLKERMNLLSSRKSDLFLIVLMFILVWMPQLMIWKRLTGELFFRPGIGERFFWSDPQIINILFSFRKGWLLYTPLAVLSFLGFFFMKGEHAKFRPLLITALIANVYILSCWWNWFYGGGFGGRVFIQSFAWLSLPIAGLTSFVLKKVPSGSLWRLSALIYFAVIFSGISLNLGQTYQYVNNYIHWDANSRASYTFMFGKYALFGKDGDKYWTLLKYHDNEKLLSGEQRDQ